MVTPPPVPSANAHARGLARLAIVLAAGAGLSFGIRWVNERGYFGWIPLERTIVLASGAFVASVLFLVFRFVAKRYHETGRPQEATAMEPLQTLAVLLVAFLAAVGAFGGIRTTLLSAGLIAFGVTLALQRPLLAVAGWFAIRIGGLFREGDRIEVNGIVGDVLDIRLVSTRLWEVGSEASPLAWGGRVAPLRATGRIVSLSNAMFLEHAVAIPMGHIPRVFDEFAVRVAYGTNWRYAREKLEEVANEVIDPAADEEARLDYERLIEGIETTPNFDPHPRIIMRLEDPWIELRLRYLVNVRERSHVRTRLAELWQKVREAEPELIPTVYDRKADLVPLSGLRPPPHP